MKSNMAFVKRMGTTAQAAEIILRKSETIRHGLCVDGHYFGIRPVKLPGGRNARLLWPLEQFERLAAGLPVEVA